MLSKLPEQMREDFLNQSSNNFFKHLPFFWMLKSDTKTAVVKVAHLSIMAPKERITHSTMGLSNISILITGKVALTFKKPYSVLNGIAVEHVEVQDEEDKP